ncbi:putative proline-rich receptor-like protein kinase PERK6 isoform X1 [Lactuca sativa]|uniref:putative proline-rich receptor-like protein kinase PERK6 isoform X1 n=1 Tax=Lactuca sativa TaxID=4236 RepID=UPI001C688E79|nr:putative proline-rich receptor-like protein kinase PERK6 isoform X1 [Lactuca sativa]
MSSAELNLEKYRIPLDEILHVTSNFSPETRIGDGGFGMVHKGELSKDGQTRTVAIKRLNQDGYQGNNEFRNELEMVSSFHHPNIIAFIGYCDEANEMIIVYDYAKNGSLDHYLQKPDKMRSLTWAQRLKICLGAAKGLKYLHSGLGEHNRVIHRDMKSANILLDDNLEAKICDFGLSRFGARNLEDTQLLTKIAGTRFYMDPLYAERSRLTKESDMYSFGVVMFEMSSGTLVYNQKCFGDDDKPQYLFDVVRSCYDDDRKAARPDKLIDPDIKDHTDMKSFHIFNKIAHKCVNLKLEQRPTMETMIRKIELALEIQLLCFYSQNHQESPATRGLDSFLIPLEEIYLATQNFNQETCIGDYEYGVVHRGQLYERWQNRTMAITRLYPKSYLRWGQDFKKELRIISSLHHQNISPFIGYCDEANERIIVHEHAVNGNVANYLENLRSKLPKLTWAQRLKICLGAARGLQCLHLVLGEESSETKGSIHCENILLDENMEAKISFFGLSRQGPTCYNPNEHISDMFSFGEIMFEILSGRRATDINKYIDVEDQFEQLQEYYRNNRLNLFIDDYIRDQIDSPCLNILIDVAYRCIKRRSHRHIITEKLTYGRWSRRRRGRGTERETPYVASSRDLQFTMNEVVERIEDATDLDAYGN